MKKNEIEAVRDLIGDLEEATLDGGRGGTAPDPSTSLRVSAGLLLDAITALKTCADGAELGNSLRGGKKSDL